MIRYSIIVLLCGVHLCAQTPIFNSTPYLGSGLAFHIASADFNGDNKPDVFVAEIVGQGTGALEVYLNNGNGTMRKTSLINLPQVQLTDGSSALCLPLFIAGGDFVKDGKPDILVHCASSPVILVYPGNGDGTFGTAVLTTAPTGILGFADVLRLGVGDFNGDGFLDIAFAEDTSSDASVNLSGPIAVLLGNGGGKFLTIKPVTGINGASTIAADLNGDGKVDLIVAQPQALSLNIFYGFPPMPGPLQILIGKGDGTFTAGQSMPLTFSPGAVTVADVNGDGKPDIIVNGYLNGMAVLLGKGDGTFKQSFSQNVGGGTGGSILAIDFIGNGKPGLLIPIANCCTNQILFLPGNGDGTFQNYIAINTGISSPNVVAADFAGHGKADLALSSFPVDLSSLGKIIATGNAGVNFSSTFQMMFNAGIGPLVSYANGASFANGTLAAGSIASAFATGGLAAGTDTPGVVPLPITDQGTGITVKDSSGSTRAAPLFYVSPMQINFQIPDATSAGTVLISINFMGQSYTTQEPVAAVAPGIFQANPATHLVSADVTTAHADGSQTLAHSYQLDASNKVVASPVGLGLASDKVFLTLYATGLKNAKAVTATIGATAIPVAFYGAQGTFVGLDQVNLGPIPQSLAGAGNVNLTISADGVGASAVNLVIQ